jgi:hypothetical protein
MGSSFRWVFNQRQTRVGPSQSLEKTPAIGSRRTRKKQTRSSSTAKRCGQRSIESFYALHLPSSAGGQVEKVPSAETGVAIHQGVGKKDIFQFNRPYLRQSPLGKGYGGVQGRLTTYGQIGVEQFLENLR